MIYIGGKWVQEMVYEPTIIDGGLVRTLTIKEVSELLHVHEQTVRRWTNRGLIKAHRIGPRGDRRFTPHNVAIFLQTNT